MSSINVPAPRGLRLASVGRLLFEVIMIAVVAIYLLPFYIMVTQAFKTPSEILFNPMGLPAHFYLNNIAKVWDMMLYPKAFYNTVLLTAISVVGIAIVSAMCAFPLARGKSRIFGLMYFILISGLLIPFYMTLSPLIKLMKDLGFMDNLLGIALAYIGRGVPFAVFLYVGFMRTLPGEVMEAAVVDGCSPLQLFWQILFPMLMPVTSTLIILNSLWIWNDFLFPLLTIQYQANRTLTLSQYVFHGQYATEWNLTFASYLISMLPLLVVYFALQRNIIAGVTAGAVKQ
jgi:raffinose/stachyose/melibiose transport system permease protein